MVHFATEVDLRALNHKAFESLIKAGCFDSLGHERRGLLEALDPILDYAQRRRKERDEGQVSLFAGGGIAEPEPDPSILPWPERDRLRHEKEALGFYLTGNPLSEHIERLRRLTSHDISTLRNGSEGSVAVGGLISRIRRNKIKSGPNAGRLMARFVLEDLEGTLPVAVFADQLQKFDPILKEGTTVVVKGTARERGADVELTLEDLVALEEAEEELVDELQLQLSARLSTNKMLQLRDLLIEHSGDLPVRMSVSLEGRRVDIRPQDRFRVELDDELVQSIEQILGPGSVRKRHSVPTSTEIH
jgi:DNA polymerase-3 subunit alpha